MFLKKVSISGFKSFPDPIDLGFRDGVTAIVGPNGCGKTNLADAIRWALGEQRVKNLRSRQMQDVIFSGSEVRKPVGMAEVSLLLSNEDQALPVEYADIHISRRLFRSGESAYLLNRRPCRLKDIHNLLLDTGIGTNTYAIIEQAQVDQILSKEPLERRGLFDEAAGIGRYKKSRAEAWKKLDETENQLLRLADRLEDIESQLRSLLQEVKKAERHQRLGEDLHEIEAFIGRYHWQSHQAKVEELGKSQTKTEDHRLAISAELATLDAEITKIREAQLSFQDRLDEAENRRYHSLEEVKNYENRLSISQERQDGRRRRRAQIESEFARISQDIENTKADLEESKEKRERYIQESESLRASIGVRETSLDGITKDLKTAGNHAVRLGSRLIELAALSTGHERIKAERQARLESLDRELATLTGNLESDRRKKEEHERRLDDTTSTIEKLEGRLAALEQRTAETIELQRRVNRELVEAAEVSQRELERLNRARAELESHERIYARHEGYRRGVAAVLAASEKGILSGIIGSLAQLVQTEQKYEAAVEAALGSSAQAVVCRTESDARKAVEFLNRLRAGRVRFFPLDLLRPRKPMGLPAGIDTEGFIGDALRLVSYDDEVAQAVEFALGGCLIAETLDAAVDILRRWRDQAPFRRIVTLDGEMVESNGVITGGTREGMAEGLLSRVRELDQLRESLSEVEEEYRRARILEDELREQFSAADESLVAQRDGMTGVKLELERNRVEIERLEGEIARLGSEIELSLTRQNEIKVELDELEPLPDDVEVSPEEEEAVREEHSTALGEVERLTSEEKEIRDGLNEDRMARSRLESRLENLSEEIERYGGELAALDGQRASLRDELSGLEKESSEADVDLDKLSTTVAQLTVDKEDEEREFLKIRQRLNEIIVELGEKMGERGSVAARDGEAGNRVAELKAAIAREVAEQDRLVIESRERTGHDIARLQLPQNFDLDRAHKRAHRLRRHRERLGEINYSAKANYDETCERRDFLRSRREELERGKGSLQESIRRLNAEAGERFLATFNQVVVNFEGTFRSLFEGGEAKLTLTGDDPLEGGIEIDVRPPGKGYQPLLGRSGGERALTAIALLFALFEVKPSPFCILDEIDAPLDDANVDRYLKLLSRFASKSQFFVITHNRRTMEAADTLIGVTMEEPGVSRLYSLAFSSGRLVTEEDQRSFSLKRRKKA